MQIRSANADTAHTDLYFIYVWRLLQGDLGPSMVYNDFTVSEMLAIEAMTIVNGQGELCGSDVTAIFERWELRVSENEVMGGCVRVPVDTLEEEFTTAEEESSLRLELRELRDSTESRSEEEGR